MKEGVGVLNAIQDVYLARKYDRLRLLRRILESILVLRNASSSQESVRLDSCPSSPRHRRRESRAIDVAAKAMMITATPGYEER